MGESSAAMRLVSLMLAIVLRAPAMALPESMVFSRPVGAGVLRAMFDRWGIPEPFSAGGGVMTRAAGIEIADGLNWPPPGIRNRDSRSLLLPHEVTARPLPMGSAGSGSSTGAGVVANSRRRNSAADIDGFGSVFVFAMRRDSGRGEAGVGLAGAHSNRDYLWCSLNNRRSRGLRVK